MAQTTPVSGAPRGGIVGKSIPKLDAFQKVTGDARYGADISLPGLLQAKLLRSPYAHARITRIDASEAERLPGVLAVVVGDPEQGFAQADVVVEQTFGTSRQKQCQMEPQACVASVEPNGKLTVWSPSQNPHLAKHKLARIFDLPQSRVRVISPH